MNDGTVLRNYLEGFTINVTGSPGILKLSDVPVIYPDMYFIDWLVVHGVRDIIEAPRPIAEQTEPLQTEPMADYSHEAPVQTEVQWKFSSSSGNSFEENATGH